MNAFRRLIFIRPDSYGDILLFEPVLRRLRGERPEWSIFVLVRQDAADVGRLLPAGVNLLTTDLQPYREAPPSGGVSLDALRQTLQQTEPTDIISCCRSKTWLDAVVGYLAPQAARWSLGPVQVGPIESAYLELRFGSQMNGLRWQSIDFDDTMPEWEANQQLLPLLGLPARVAEKPTLRVGASEIAEATRILQGLSLRPGEFMLCAPAGVANVKIKTWRAEGFAQVIADAELDSKVPTLIIGHESERPVLETVVTGARERGAEPKLWVGKNGEFPLLAALAAQAKLYFGNDTGALHAAAALGVPVIAIYGGGTWPRFAPASDKSRAIVAPLKCFGCEWTCHFGDAPCLTQIPASRVMRVVRGALRSPLTNSRVVTVDAASEFSAVEWAGRVETGQYNGTKKRLLGGKAFTDVVQIVRASIVNAEQLEIAQHARNLAAAQLQDLRSQFTALEQDYTARGALIEEQGVKISRLEGEFDSRLKELTQLYATCEALKNERNLLRSQLDDLQRNFNAVEADHVARGKVIEQQGQQLSAYEAEIHQRLAELKALYPQLELCKNERDLLAAQLADLRSNFNAVEADRIARGKVIEQQGQRVSELEKLVWLTEQDRDRWRRAATPPSA